MAVTNNIIKILKPWYLYYRAVGLIPYQLKTTNSRITAVPESKLFIFRLIIINGLYFYCISDVLSTPFSDVTGHGIILTSLYQAMQYEDLICSDLSILISFKQRKKIVHILRLLEEIISNVELEDIKINSHKYAILTVILIFLVVVKATVLWVWTSTQLPNAYYGLTLFPRLMVSCVDTTIHLQYAILMALIKKIFQSFNQDIMKLRKCATPSCSIHLGILRKTLKMKTEMYEKLVHVIHKTNAAFQMQILLRISTSYLGFNYASFYLFKSFKSENGNNYTGIRVYCFFFDISEIIIMNAVTSLVCDEVSINSSINNAEKSAKCSQDILLFLNNSF